LLGEEIRPGYASHLRRKPPNPSDIWHLDEVAVTISGRKYCLWRAVDQDGNVLDEIVQNRRNTKAAKCLLIPPNWPEAAYLGFFGNSS